MSSKGYKVTSFIVCDDVRREASGKDTIVGVYNKAILVGSFPTRMPQITFRITYDVDRTNFKNIKLVVIGPDNKKMVEARGEIKIKASDEPVGFVFRFGSPEFQKPGTYIVRMGLDSNPRRIGEFMVRIAKSKLERGRLGLTEQNA